MSARHRSRAVPACSGFVSANSLAGGIALSASPKGKTIAASCSHVLINEDRIPIRIDSDEAGRPRGALVRLLLQLHPTDSQLAPQLTDVGERGQLFRALLSQPGLKVRMFLSG
jgi:hypothetical protein